MKVFDITQPKDGWERNYALMEFLFQGLKTIGWKKIYVYYDDQCATCDVRGEGIMCDRCSEKADEAWKARNG